MRKKPSLEGITCTFREGLATMRLRNATALVTGREDQPTNGKERTHGQRRKPAERNEEETGQNDGGKTGREAGQEKRLGFQAVDRLVVSSVEHATTLRSKVVTWLLPGRLYGMV